MNIVKSKLFSNLCSDLLNRAFVSAKWRNSCCRWEDTLSFSLKSNDPGGRVQPRHREERLSLPLWHVHSLFHICCLSWFQSLHIDQHGCFQTIDSQPCLMNSFFFLVALVIDILFLSAERHIFFIFYYLSLSHSQQKNDFAFWAFEALCMSALSQPWYHASGAFRLPLQCVASRKAPYWFLSRESIVGHPCSINTPSSLFKQLCNRQQTPTAVGEHGWVVLACGKLLFRCPSIVNSFPFIPW